VAALLPVARKVVQEDRLTDAAVLGLLDAVKGWDLHDGTTDRFPAAAGLRNTLTPYRGSGLQTIYGAGGGGISHLAREVGAQFERDGSTPTNPLVRAYLIHWLQAAVTGGGRGASGANRPARAERVRPATPDASRAITIPYQRTIPHNLPVVDALLDLVSPPLTCLDQGTIWSQPGNTYTHIVDLADVDNSRSMCAPGNAEDAAGSFRANQMDLWVAGTTHPAPLSRDKIEPLTVQRETLQPQPYQGPASSPERTVTDLEPSCRFVAAIGPVVAEVESKPPLPGRKPDDPTLEAAFRFVLRHDRTPDEIDKRLTEIQAYVANQPALQAELREALKLGIYLIEEAQAGRLRIPYGSPHCLRKMRAMLDALH
jgi:hypothetical protein